MSDRPPADAATESGRPAPERRPVTYVRIEPRRLRQAVILTLVLFAGFLLARWALSALGGFLLLVLLSWLFAIAMEPAVVALARRGWRRGAATGVVMLAFVVAGAAFLGLFGSLLFSQASEFITNLPALVEDTVAQVNEWFNLELDPDTILDQLNLDASNLTGIATDVAGGIVGILGSIATLLFDLFTILFFAFYISADSPASCAAPSAAGCPPTGSARSSPSGRSRSSRPAASSCPRSCCRGCRPSSTRCSSTSSTCRSGCRWASSPAWSAS